MQAIEAGFIVVCDKPMTFDLAQAEKLAEAVDKSGVVFAVMLETGFTRTEFGTGILGSCFINDLGTVIVL